MARMMIKSVLMLIVILQARAAIGQTIAFQDLLQQKADWQKFAENGSKFQFEGRFEGRTANTIKIARFDVVCSLPSNATFPESMSSGQRIEVIGRFRFDNSKLTFVVSRILIKDIDIDRLRSRVKDVPEDQPERLLAIAAEYQTDAEFYGDSDLLQEIAAIRANGIERMRVMARGDITKVTELLERSKSLKLKPEIVQLLQFERIWSAMKVPQADVNALVAELKQSCPGWDRLVPPVSESLRRAFSHDAVGAFLTASDADRQGLHRLLYKSLRLRQLRASLESDGSNGLDLARLIRTEFGEDEPLAAEFEELEVQYRLAHLAGLSRSDLKELTTLLPRLKRPHQVPDAVRSWLSAQEQKFGTSTLAGLLRTADEYLYVADLLPSDDYRQQGADLLKRAWAAASDSSPNDAEQIADRLQGLGWERLNNVWMTSKQMNALPKDNVQLAIREGRVVRGMTMEQVVQTLGQPRSVSRLASKQSVCELWSFEEAKTPAGMVVRFRRSVADPKATSLVEDISVITGR